MSVPVNDPIARRALVARIKAILTKPADTWAVIDGEPATIKSLYQDYLMYIAAIGPVCMLVGSIVFLHAPIVTSLVIAVLSYAAWLVGAYVSMLVIDYLAPHFGGTRDKVQAMKVAVYSATASAVASVFSLVPALSMLAILGLYGLYLMWLGLPKLMKVGEDKAVGYFVATLVVLVVVSVVFWTVVTSLLTALIWPLLVVRPVL